MASRPPEEKRPPRISLRQKILAGAVFAVAAVVLTFVDRLPSAGSVDERTFTAGHTEALVLYGLPQGPVMNFDGALGSGLDLRIAQARPEAAMLASLEQGGVPPPATKAVALTWLGATDPAGRISLTIANERSDPRAGIALASTGSIATPQLRITAIETMLKVEAQAVAGDSPTAPPAVLKLDDKAVPQPWASLVPVHFEVPPGQSLLLTFPNAEAVDQAAFRLGTPGEDGELASHLPVLRFAIGRRQAGSPQLTRADRGVCAARQGKMLMLRLEPRPESCSAEGALAIESLEVKAARLGIGISGNGFERKNGKTVAAGVVSAIGNNKIVAALLAIAYATLAGWVWKTITGLGQ